MHQQKIGSRVQLTYHPKLQHQKCHLLKVDKQLLQYLSSPPQSQISPQPQLIIQGNPQTELILHISQKSYKIKGINISTTLLIVSETGTIVKQTGSYLDAQKFSPHFWEIYATILGSSLRMPDREVEEGMDFQGVVGGYGFTEGDVRRECYLGEQDFGRLRAAMNLVKITDSDQYIYVTLEFSVWIMRQILQAYNDLHLNFFQPITQSHLLSTIKLLNPDILSHISHQYSFQVHQPPTPTPSLSPSLSFSLTPKSIMLYILSQLKLAKTNYSSPTFEQVLDEMLLIYMPAQAQITSSMVRGRGSKEMEDLYNCRFLFFVDEKGSRYVGYDYMAIDTDVNVRLRFLGGFKNRWNVAELKAIFRGIDSTENGKYYQLPDMLLKKFRKYGDDYQIKFILPNK